MRDALLVSSTAGRYLIDAGATRANGALNLRNTSGLDRVGADVNTEAMGNNEELIGKARLLGAMAEEELRRDVPMSDPELAYFAAVVAFTDKLE